ncbi:hypothetical protein ACTHAL_000197 [Priestia flexa]|uniref:hypothetical protein n=1 Tax=Bacillaceae TaxID=186817 RepID=UPI000A45A847|nr:MULTISPECIES: hypothetical protein [Bacillaceae]
MNNYKELSPQEKAKIMLQNLQKLGELPYSNYKPEESYQIYEQSRGQNHSGK